MMLDDPILRRWLGAHADLLADPVPILLGAAVAALGWWLARNAPGAPPVSEGA